MDPSNAMVRAGVTTPSNADSEKSGNCRSGSPVGTSPMTGVLVSHSTPSSVPAIRAAKVGGRYLLSCAGHSTPTTRVTAAIAREWKFTPLIASGNPRNAPIGPPVEASAPRKGSVCNSMMMIPMPDINPEMTE